MNKLRTEQQRRDYSSKVEKYAIDFIYSEKTEVEMENEYTV